MANFYLCPFASFLQLLSDTGIVLSGGLIWTYRAGTTAPTNTWTDITGVTPNSNPIQLGANGRLNNVSIWQQGGVPIKVIFSTNAGTTLSPVFGTQLGPTFDQVSGINDPASVLSVLSSAASGSGADLVANAMRSYDTAASLRAANVPILTAGQTLIVDLQGMSAVGDGGGGTYYWNSASTATDDGINVITPTGLATGRYLKLVLTTAVIGNPLSFIKAAKTSRSANTTPSIDPDLQVSLLSGSYRFQIWMTDFSSGTSAGGLAGRVTYSGTFSSGSWGMVGSGSNVANVSALGINSVSVGTFQTTQAGNGNMLISGAFVATSSGTFGLSWAQNTSNATASVLEVGSWMMITRVT